MEDKKRRSFIDALVQTARAITGNPKLEITFGLGESSENTLVLPELPEILSDKDKELARGVSNRAAFLRRYQSQNKDVRNQTLSMWHLLAHVEAARTEAHGLKDFPGVMGQLETLNQQEVMHRRQSASIDLPYLTGLALRDALDMTLTKDQQTVLKLFDEDIPADVKDWVKEFAPYLDDEPSRLQAYSALLKLLGAEQKEEDQPEGEEGQEEDNFQASGEALEEDQRTPEEIAGDVAPDPELEDDSESEPVDGEDSGASGARAKEKERVEYHAFTTEFDKTIHAAELVTDREIKRLQAKFKNLRRGTNHLANRLASQLQKYLLAPVRTGWKFDQEEGLIDPQKLTQIITSSESKPFRLPATEQLKDTVVSILVDNSGSMRGRPIEMAAVSTDLLARTLERCGVPTEVLGFTTQTWKGGQSRLKWLGEGKPTPVGRLNDLLHVIYKAADEPHRKAEVNFSAMLADDILKENVDGESLVWASQRLLMRQEERKILIIISDGAPVDYATDQHNGEGYLDAHLKKVIQQIESQNKIDLLAIGIGHDVTQYYENAIVIKDPSELGPTIVKRFLQLFDAS